MNEIIFKKEKYKLDFNLCDALEKKLKSKDVSEELFSIYKFYEQRIEGIDWFGIVVPYVLDSMRKQVCQIELFTLESPAGVILNAWLDKGSRSFPNTSYTMPYLEMTDYELEEAERLVSRYLFENYKKTNILMEFLPHKSIDNFMEELVKSVYVNRDIYKAGQYFKVKEKLYVDKRNIHIKKEGIKNILGENKEKFGKKDFVMAWTTIDEVSVENATMVLCEDGVEFIGLDKCEPFFKVVVIKPGSKEFTYYDWDIASNVGVSIKEKNSIKRNDFAKKIILKRPSEIDKNDIIIKDDRRDISSYPPIYEKMCLENLNKKEISLIEEDGILEQLDLKTLAKNKYITRKIIDYMLKRKECHDNLLHHNKNLTSNDFYEIYLNTDYKYIKDLVMEKGGLGLKALVSV